MKPLRVVFDVAALALGGMERQLVLVTAGLRARGHAPLVLVNKGGSAYAEDFARECVPVRPLSRMSRYDLRIVSDIAEAARVHRADVIVGVSFNATLWARLAARRAGCAAVTAEHSTERARPLKLVLSNRLLAAGTDAIIACAAAQVPWLIREGNPAARICVVPNGVDVRRFRPDPPAGALLRAELSVPRGAFLVGMVAGHRPEKRHDRFIRLIELLSGRGLDCVGMLVGDGPLQEKTRRDARSSPARDRLLFAGTRSDMPGVYSACDVCVLCSDSEAMPLTLLESQACATPVVAMGAGGVAETFVDGVGGILVPQADQGAFAEAVASFAGDADRRRFVGAAGRRWVTENRSVEAMIGGYERVLGQAVARHDAGRGRGAHA